MSGSQRGCERVAGEAARAERPEDLAPGMGSRAAPAAFASPVEEAPNAVADVPIDAPVSRVQGSVAEVLRPAAKQATQSTATRCDAPIFPGLNRSLILPLIRFRLLAEGRAPR